MKIIYALALLFIFISCSEIQIESEPKTITSADTHIVITEFQTILDTTYLTGSILVYDVEEETYYSNDFEWAKVGQLPASTFKIPNSIIALETGIVKSDSTLFKWDGEKRANKIWEQDLLFKEAFHYSCVPCYQEIAREIGYERMNTYSELYNYGTIKVDSITIDKFWLEGDSKVSQFQQIKFLKRFYTSRLSISESTEDIMKRMMIIEENAKYTLSGKTGWSFYNQKDNGWFVGYIETKEKVYFFATNIEPTEKFNLNRFPRIRKAVTYEALKQMNIIN